MIDYENLPVFGTPLKHVENYVYYDGPKTFAMRSLNWPIIYIINTVDEDDETVTALMVRMTEHRFQAMRSGLIDFREAFTDAPEDSLVAVVWSLESELVHKAELIPYESRDLPPDWLPREGARLNLPTKTVEAFEADELRRVSDAQGRTLFAIEVQSSTTNVTEFPAKNSGQVVLALNGSFESIARERSARRKLGARGATRTSNAHREISPSLVGMRAASFVLVFAVESDTMVEPTSLVEETLDSLGALVAAAALEDTTILLEELKTHSRRTRYRFLDLLAPLVSVGSGLAITSAVAHTNDIRRVEANAESVYRAVTAIETAPPTVEPHTVNRGILMGMNVRTQRFELTDASTGASYSGYMTDDAVTQANGLPVGDHSFVRASLTVESPFFAEDDGSGGEITTLTRIETLPPA